MARREPHVTRRRDLLRAYQVRRPALEHDRARDRAAHRATHMLPLDRGPGMEQQPAFGQGGYRLARGDDVEQHGLRRQHQLDRGRVGLLDPLVVHEPREPHRRVRVAQRGRTPVERDHRNPGGGDRLREAGEPDVDRLQLTGQQLVEPAHTRAPTRSAASWTAAVLLGARTAPASESSRCCAARP